MNAPSACSCSVPNRLSNWYPPVGFGPRGHGFAPSGPVSLTSWTVGTMRHTSTNISLDGAFVAGSISRIFGGSGNVIRIRTFSRRLRKALAGATFGAKIIGMDRPKQRIARLRIELAPPLEQLESRLRARRRELEIVGRHVAVSARASAAGSAQ